VKRCLIFMGGPGLSGGSNVIFEHAINARSNGYEVTFVMREKIDPERDIAWHRIGKMKEFDWLSFEEVGRRKYDVAMATYWPTCYELWRANADQFVYFVQSVESRFPSRADLLGRLGAESTYRLPLGFVTEASYIQRYLKRLHGQEAGLAINGIRKEIFRPDGDRHARCEAGRLRVLVEGSLEPERKGTVEAIEVSREAGVDEIWLLTLSPIDSYPGVDRVFSNVAIEATPPIYRSCDVLVKLSRVEGMFGPPLEMFHCGGTAVTYDVTGHEHYVFHGRNALVARTLDRKRVVQYLRDLKRWPQLLAALKKGAKETAATWPSWEQSSRVFWQAVTKAAERSRTDPSELEQFARFFHMSCRLAYSESPKVADDERTKRQAHQDAVQEIRQRTEQIEVRLAALQEGLQTTNRELRAIYESRIWRTLCWLGSFLIPKSGGGRFPFVVRGDMEEPKRPFESSPGSSGGILSALRTKISVGWQTAEILLTVDFPGTRAPVSVKDVVAIRGWALARSGIRKVSIRIDNADPIPVAYGLPRPDVAAIHFAYPDTEKSGFRFFWDTLSSSPGYHTIDIVAEDNLGFQKRESCQVIVDQEAWMHYSYWIARNEPTAQEKRRLAEVAAQFPIKPKISVVVPVYKTPLDLLERCVRSVRAQIYPHWELCIADDGSNSDEIRTFLETAAQQDGRIKFTMLSANRGISSATNEAVKLSTGQYISFLDSDDELADFALFEVVRAINEDDTTDLYYSDEDKLDAQGRRYDFFFKPGWSPELFLCCNYLCHFIVVKRWLWESLGGMNETYRHGSQDYEFLLRVIERTTRIRRIPKVLYHWRAVEGSTARSSSEKPNASAAGVRALREYLARNEPGATVEEVGPCRYRVNRPLKSHPLVSVIIPTAGNMSLLRAAVENLIQKTDYSPYEIRLLDNSESGAVQAFAQDLIRRGVPVHYSDWRGHPFNYSRMNNRAVQESSAPFVLFLNDDVAIITESWLSILLEYACLPKVGAVGAQLLYPDGTIQHAGVVLGIYGNSSHAFKRLPAHLPHYFDLPNLARNCAAVTAACMLVERTKFLEVDGFDEVNLPVSFQDLDFCLKLVERGYRNVYVPYARLYHYESISKIHKEPPVAEDEFVKTKWAKWIDDDPWYNPNLTRAGEDFSLRLS